MDTSAFTKDDTKDLSLDANAKQMSDDESSSESDYDPFTDPSVGNNTSTKNEDAQTNSSAQIVAVKQSKKTEKTQKKLRAPKKEVETIWDD